MNSSFLVYSKIVHKRFLPKINQFLYEVFYFCFDVKELKESRSKIFSFNKFNIFSFYTKDHGNKNGNDLEGWIRNILSDEKLIGSDSKNLNSKIKKIFLLTHPRILGYAFNPVSFWFCLDESENLCAVLAQVNNTFGETHSYLIFNHDHSPILENQWLEADKKFHVSPFFKVEGNYKFRFIFNKNKIAVWIDYFLSDEDGCEKITKENLSATDQNLNFKQKYSEKKVLLTSLICERRLEINNKNLVKAFFLIPLMTLKVIVLIHFQALKIISKKIKYIPKPKQLVERLTKTKYQ